MKILLVITFLTCMLVKSSISCSCVGNSFCDNIDKLAATDSDLVFMGSFIQSEHMASIFNAVQFKVENIYFGEIITPDSPLYGGGQEYVNTDSTIWVFTGNSSICLPDVKEQSAIIAITYREYQIVSASDFGYVTHMCETSYLPVSPEGIVSGWITEAFQEDSISIEAFEEFYDTGCDVLSGGTSTANTEYDEIEFSIYPQPTTYRLNITAPVDLHDWEINLYDLTGRSIAVEKGVSLDLSFLNPGVYFIQFTKDRQRYIKKIIKI